MHDASCIDIWIFQVFHVTSHVVGIFALHFVSTIQLLWLYQLIQFLTCTRIPRRDSHCEYGLVRCCLCTTVLLSLLISNTGFLSSTSISNTSGAQSLFFFVSTPLFYLFLVTCLIDVGRSPTDRELGGSVTVHPRAKKMNIAVRETN